VSTKTTLGARLRRRCDGDHTLCFLSASVGGLWPAAGRNLTERVCARFNFRERGRGEIFARSHPTDARWE
jgi:hypothetical protein